MWPEPDSSRFQPFRAAPSTFLRSAFWGATAPSAHPRKAVGPAGDEPAARARPWQAQRNGRPIGSRRL
eukprot:6125812-Alexandrium_andersonii.AAC.1